jgi:mRNA-degrading endonuclease RelE of RelBE toxin-antitoxin system
MKVSFIETPTFTRIIIDLLEDDEYRELQNTLSNDPEMGDIIKGGGGIRVIYYFVKDRDNIIMLLAYPKSKKDDLTDKETAVLRDIAKEF